MIEVNNEINYEKLSSEDTFNSLTVMRPIYIDLDLIELSNYVTHNNFEFVGFRPCNYESFIELVNDVVLPIITDLEVDGNPNFIEKIEDLEYDSSASVMIIIPYQNEILTKAFNYNSFGKKVLEDVNRLFKEFSDINKYYDFTDSEIENFNTLIDMIFDVVTVNHNVDVRVIRDCFNKSEAFRKLEFPMLIRMDEFYELEYFIRPVYEMLDEYKYANKSTIKGFFNRHKFVEEYRTQAFKVLFKTALQNTDLELNNKLIKEFRDKYEDNSELILELSEYFDTKNREYLSIDFSLLKKEELEDSDSKSVNRRSVIKKIKDWFK